LGNADNLHEILRAGIEAARQGDKERARQYFERVVQLDDQNEAGWMWLASTIDSVEQRKGYLQKVLQINPNNERAREALSRLSGSASTADADRQAIERLRRLQRRQAAPAPRPTPSPQPTPSSDDEGLSLGVALIAAVLVLIAIVVIIFAVVSSQESDEPIGERTLAAFVNATETPTINPALFTDTPVFGIIVAEPSTAPTLPPTFTSTPPPSETPLGPPSPTPIPLSDFTLFYSSLSPGQAQLRLFSARGDGSEAQPASNENLEFRDIAIDPTGQKIAFVRETTSMMEDVDGNITEITAPQLFVAPLNNLAAARQITTINGNVLAHPAWGSDGVSLVFVSDFDNDEEIWFITDDGQNLRKLTDNTAVDNDPVWLLDGSKIIFASDLDSPGFTEIYSMNPDGTNITRLTDDSGSSFNPSVSPDNTLIAFVSDRGGDGDIFIMDIDGQRPFLVTSDDGGAEDRLPVFSPDGRWIIFSSNREDGIFQLYAISLDGDVLVRLTNDEREAFSADFLPAFGAP